ncbi:carbon-nitrogen hydrolase family protein [Streptomyces sp. CWNU-52B]|uniref:carbon-nitrogen hydrolase family protein n=1 Tax=unclassified Streptomyces TaxID=2593676 RepID=UPI0039BFB647
MTAPDATGPDSSVPDSSAPSALSASALSPFTVSPLATAPFATAPLAHEALPGPLPETSLRIAVVQNAARPLKVADNARAAAARAAHAAREGARLVVLPELHLCSYDLPRLAEATTDATATAEAQAEAGAGAGAAVVHADRTRHITDRRLDPLVDIAVHRRITVVIGAAVRRHDGRLTNSLLAVEPGGTVTVVYDKQHLWHDEEADLFSPGTRGAFLTVDDWRLGLGICYDMSFPEHARAAALAGAHAQLYPAAFAAGTEHRAAVYLKARALENTIYTVFANPLEGPAHRPCDGLSAVYGPDGGTVSHAGPGQNTVLLADLEPKAVTEARVHLRMLAEQRSLRLASPVDPPT